MSIITPRTGEGDNQLTVDSNRQKLFVGSNEFETLSYTNSTGASKTLAVGTVMGKVSVVAGAITPDAGNTGDGTVTALALAIGGQPIPGDYNLECTGAVTNGGVFKLEDPNGDLVANDITMTAGAGAATTFIVGGLTFIITDGAADFIVGDTIALTIDTSGKALQLESDAIDGSQYPVGVLANQYVVANAATVSVVICTKGYVDEDYIVFDNGTDDLDTIVAGRSLRDRIKSDTVGIVLESGVEMDAYDNA